MKYFVRLRSGGKLRFFVIFILTMTRSQFMYIFLCVWRNSRLLRVWLAGTSYICMPFEFCAALWFLYLKRNIRTRSIIINNEIIKNKIKYILNRREKKAKNYPYLSHRKIISELSITTEVETLSQYHVTIEVNKKHFYRKYC